MDKNLYSRNLVQEMHPPSSNNLQTNSKNVSNVRYAAVVPKYSPLLYCILFLLLIDLVINSFSELLVYSQIALLIIYM